MDRMNAIVIGAGSESVYAIQRATEMGIFTIALDGDPEAPGLQYADKSLVVDIRKPDLIYEILDQWTPQTVIPVPIGRYLTSTGAVNDHYKLKGVTQRAAALCTDKHLFRTVISQREEDIKIEHLLISGGESHISNIFSSETGALLVKPRYGSGSRAVQVFPNASSFKNDFMSRLPLDEDFVVESLVAGIEYGVDAAIIQGEFQLILLREKVLTPLPYRQCVGYYSVIEDDCNAEILKCVGKAVSKAGKILELDNCLLHADIIYNNGAVFIIEISARPSGHHLHNLFTPMATGVDMITEYLKFSFPQLMQPYSFVPVQTKCLLIKFFDFSNCRVLQVPEKENLQKHYPIKEYKCNLKRGMILKQAVDGCSLMARGFYVIEGKSRLELDTISGEIEKQFGLEEI